MTGHVPTSRIRARSRESILLGKWLLIHKEHNDKTLLGLIEQQCNATSYRSNIMSNNEAEIKKNTRLTEEFLRENIFNVISLSPKNNYNVQIVPIIGIKPPTTRTRENKQDAKMSYNSIISSTFSSLTSLRDLKMTIQ